VPIILQKMHGMMILQIKTDLAQKTQER